MAILMLIINVIDYTTHNYLNIGHYTFFNINYKIHYFIYVVHGQSSSTTIHFTHDIKLKMRFSWIHPTFDSP